MTSDSSQIHVPVLLDQVVAVLAPKPGERYLDLTAGYGGHARAILGLTGTAGPSVLVDRDQFALNHLGDLREAGATLVHDDYLGAARGLVAANETFDLILMDIGVSSPQLDRPDRGFSFMADGPLDMRMDPGSGQSAADFLNRESAAGIARVLVRYGDESPHRANRIASAIVRARPLTTTWQLADTVTDVIPRTGKIHPATKTFQAVRIAVNDELGQLEGTLPLLPDLLRPGGRVAVISFHSLEDRIVKRYFGEQADAGYEASLKVLTRKPIDGKNFDTNPRARSAKLRAAMKI